MEADGSTQDDGELAEFIDVCREGYLYAMEIARARHDPDLEWEAFRETLWSYLTRVFGVDDAASSTLDGLPDLDEAPSGDAREVAAWLADLLGDGQRSAASPGS